MMSASTVTSVVTAIRNTLQQNANKADAQMCQKYFKNVVEFHGIRAPKLNTLFKELYASQIKDLDVDDQLKVAYNLFDSKMGEEKSVGCMILTKNTKNLGVQHLSRFEELIDNHIYDWGTADKFSGQVLHFLIAKDKKVPSLIAKWKDAENIWRKRVSCVSFVKLARHGKYNDIIFDICATTIKCNERFVQLGAGWVLRELSLADLSGVKEFIKKNYEHMSREGLRYAIEKMSGQDKAKLLAYTGSASSEEISDALSESAELSDDEDLVVPKKGKKVTKKRKIEEVSEDEEEDEDEKPIRTRSAKAARRK